MGKLILKSQDLKNGVGSYCDEGDLLALLIAHGLVERAEKPATGGKVWPTTDDEVAETSRAAQAAQMGKDTQVRTQAGINAKPAAESMPQRRRLASLSVLENTATPSRESQAAESQGAHEGELGKSPKSRRRSIHVIPDFIQKLNRRFSIQVDSDSEYSDSETEDMDAPQPLPNRTGMLHMLNEKRKNFMGHKDHSDDKNHISPLSAVRSRFSKIEKKHSHETHQYLEQYSKRVKHRRASVIKSENVRRTIPAWVACIAVGLLVGVADAAMLHSITELFTIKTKLLQWTTDHHDPVAAFGFVLALCLPLTMIAAAMVVYVAPKAAGSGLAEVKAMLNGSRSKGLLTFTTAFVKIVGIVFTIIGGLALGREGPMVHVGAAMANFILHVPYFHRRIIGVHATRRAQAVFNIRSEYLNHYVIMGGAAGVAAAFNAPITGVLYMLEEMASHWPTWLTVQVFVSTGFAALTMQCIKNSLYGIGDETSAFLVNDHSIIARDWKSGDMPIFMLIGIVGGLASTVLSICCKKMFMLRRRITSRLGNGYSFFEVAVITLLAVATYVFLPLAFECEASEVSHSYHGGDDASDHGTNHSYSGDSHGDGHLRRFLSAGGEAGFVRYRCDDHYHNQMASLAHWNPEHAIVMLWSSDMKFDTMVLLVYLVVYMVQFMLLPGTKIPIGTFAPNMLMGSLLGRFIGEYCGSGYSDPAIFAQVGAAAMLSGYTHMTLTIAAIIGEAVGTTALIIPLTTAILISRTITKLLAGDTVDEFQIHVKNLWFLESDVPISMKGGTCNSLIDDNVPQLQLKMSPLGVAAVLIRNEHLHYHVFPVVSASGHLHGLVSRLVLAKALANKKGNERRCSTFADVVLLAANKHRERNTSGGGSLRSSQQLAYAGRALNVTSSKLKKSTTRMGSALSTRLSNNRPTAVSTTDSKSGPASPKVGVTPIDSVTPLGTPITTIANDLAVDLTEQRQRRITPPSPFFRSNASHSHRFGRFCIFKTVDIGCIMDTAPYTFPQDTPVDRIYGAFANMNLVVIGVVSAATNQYAGLITRRRLLEYTGAAHRMYEREEAAKPWSQKIREGLCGETPTTDIATRFQKWRTQSVEYVNKNMLNARRSLGIESRELRSRPLAIEPQKRTFAQTFALQVPSEPNTPVPSFAETSKFFPISEPNTPERRAPSLPLPRINTPSPSSLQREPENGQGSPGV